MMSCVTERGSAHRTAPSAEQLRARTGRVRGSNKEARVQEESQAGASEGGGKPPTTLLRRARMATTYIHLGHSYTSSHTRAVESPLPDANVRPSGLKHTDFT